MHGMLTTVAYQLGPKQPPIYALEGAVSSAGQSVRWLKENMKLFKEDEDIGELCLTERKHTHMRAHTHIIQRH